MRFNKLVMQAFGTFKDNVSIDFANLNNGGIFLITGPTGGGKTTIFDAICFALYGRVSSFSDSTGKIRSNYADSNTITYVELEFSISNKNYYIKRIPSQENVINRKGNLSKINHEVILKYDDVIISDIQLVSNKIMEIIGLNQDMFREVVMLPQNDFKKLLISNTKDKEPIFRTIFNTSFIKQFQERISEDCKKKISEIEEKTTILNTLISQMDEKYKDLSSKDMQNYDDIISDLNLIIYSKTKNNEENKNNLKLKQDNLKMLQEKYKTIDELNNSIVNYRNYTEEYNKLINDSNIKDYRIVLENHSNAEKLSEALNSYDLLKEEIENLKGQIEDLKNSDIKKNEEKVLATQKREELNSKKPIIENYRLERLKLSEERNASISREKVRKELLKLDEELNDFNIDRENDIAYKDELLNKKLELENEVNILKEKVVDISSLYIKKETINEELKALNEIKDKLTRKEELIILVEDCELEFNRLKEENIKLSGEKISISRKLQLNLASRLAKELKDKTPCPVCGSKDHPDIAHFSDDVNDSSLENVVSKLARNNLDTDQILQDKRNYATERTEIEDFLATSELVNQNSLNKANIDNFIQSKLDEIDEVQKNIDFGKENNELYNQKCEVLKQVSNEILDVTNKIESITKENEERFNKLNEAKAQIKIYENTRNLEDIDKEINDLSTKISDYENEYDATTKLEFDLLNDIIEIGKNISTINSNISSNEGKLTIYEENIKKYKELFNSDEEYLLCLNNDIDEISNYVKEYDSNLAIITNKIDELKPLVENKEIADLSSLLDEINSSNIEIESLNKLIIEEESNIRNSSSKISDITNSYDLMKDKIKEKNRIKKLSDLANGQLSSRITFEQYILSIYFEDVIDEANVLLNDLSKNRFRLIRKTSLQGKGYQGLEINLYDNLTSSIREVNTFSGGESFMASLSLALGLSNVIRRNSSLVSIDTLFIDEGFGSLDLESLDQAYNILCSLRTNDRVIGIISHVSELKNRIKNQIVVQKTDFGSKLSVLD